MLPIGLGRRTAATSAIRSGRFRRPHFPAIVGAGSLGQAGEASLRIAKEINSIATPNNRPVSDLKVTYLVFPGTAETPWGPPDLEKLQAKCEALVKEIGGAGVPLHHWENIIPPLPTPTPTPTPGSTATPSPPYRPKRCRARRFRFAPHPHANALTIPPVPLRFTPAILRCTSGAFRSYHAKRSRAKKTTAGHSRSSAMISTLAPGAKNYIRRRARRNCAMTSATGRDRASGPGELVDDPEAKRQLARLTTNHATGREPAVIEITPPPMAGGFRAIWATVPAESEERGDLSNRGCGRMAIDRGWLVGVADAKAC